MTTTDASINDTTSPCTEPECLRHQHWSQFDEPPYGAHAFIGLLMALMSIFSVGGNGFVIYLYAKFPSLRNPTTTLIINLAVSDLGLAMTGFPLYVISSFYGRWAFPAQVCEFYGFAGGAFGLLSINTLAAISLDRYYILVRSVDQRRKMSYKWTAGMIVVVWVYSFAWALPPLLGWNRYTWEGFGTTCSFDYLTKSSISKMFIVAMFVGGFIVPLIIIIYSYTYILICVFRQRSQFGKNPKGGKQRRQVELDTAKTIMLVIGLYCVSWTPYAIISLIGVYGNQTLITPVASAVPGLLAKSSTLYNPIVYAFCLPKFKKKIQKMFLRVFCGLEGDLVVIENCSTLDYECSNVSNQSTTSLYRKPAYRARSGMRRSEFSGSSQGSLTFANEPQYGQSPRGGKTGVIVKYKNKNKTKKNKMSTSNNNTSNEPSERDGLNSNKKQQQDKVLCEALGDNLELFQELLKKNNIKIKFDKDVLQLEKKSSAADDDRLK